VGRILRFTLIGCGGLIALVVVIGVLGALIGGGQQAGTPSSPPERQEQDEGVEGGGKDPEAKKPLEGEKAKPQNEQGQQGRQQQEQAQGGANSNKTVAA